jgi:hypothetical protein
LVKRLYSPYKNENQLFRFTRSPTEEEGQSRSRISVREIEIKNLVARTKVRKSHSDAFRFPFLI